MCDTNPWNSLPPKPGAWNEASAIGQAGAFSDTNIPTYTIVAKAFGFNDFEWYDRLSSLILGRFIERVSPAIGLPPAISP
jgi:hypothetical protein